MKTDSPRRKMGCGKKLLIVLGVLLFLGVIGSLIPSDETHPTESTLQDTSDEVITQISETQENYDGPHSSLVADSTESQPQKHIQREEEAVLDQETQASRNEIVSSSSHDKSQSPFRTGKVELAREQVDDGPLKTQVDQRWYFTELPSTEDALKKIVDDLHKQALAPRSTFKYRRSANSVLIYVYVDKEYAEYEPFGASWLGRSIQYTDDETNRIEINHARFKKLLAPLEIRHGLEESKRKEIFMESFKGEVKVNADAWEKYPVGEGINALSTIERFKMIDEGKEKLNQRIMEKYSITEEQLWDIYIEGLAEGFR